MDSDESTVVPTEDVVDSLIEFLVDPLLPTRSSLRETPSIDLQQSVAKQMHAVVLLYNYYHRKQFPQLEFLDFDSFCKVAINSKPNLLVHMNHMQICNAQPDNFDKQFSIMEKAIIDACKICSGLDASKDAPNLEDWPISKVVVFLTDTAKENCLLLMSSMTQGVWSLIEKSCDDSSRTENIFAKNRVTERSLGNDLSVDCLRKFALSAVEEKTGAAQKDILLLERHVVYSLSEEKMAACFYIMKLNKSINQDTIQEVPINDAINSLKGPLVKKNFGNCTVTPVVEYFHLLPYVGIIAQWYSRRMFIDESQLILERNTDVNMDLPPRNDDESQLIPERNTDVKMGLPPRNDGLCTKESAENIDRSRATCQIAAIVDTLNSKDTKEKVKRKKNTSDGIINVSNANRGRQVKAKASSYRKLILDELQRMFEGKTDVNIESRTKLILDEIQRKLEGMTDVNMESLKLILDEIQHKLEGKTDVNMESCTKASAGNIDGSHAPCQIVTNVNMMTSEDITEKVKHKENNNDCIGNLSNANCGHHVKGDAGTSIGSPPGFGKTCLTENDSHAATTCLVDKLGMVDFVREPCNDNCADVYNNGSSQDRKIQRDHQLVPSQPHARNGDKTQAIRLPKQNELSQNVLKILLKKRSKLSHQLRHQVDELARFENNLQTISSGGEDNLMLIAESVIEACNMTSTIDTAEIHMKKHLPYEERDSPQCFKKRKLSEAVLHSSSTCQELDDICCENFWMLPQYSVFPSNGGFTANVTVRGADFECSECGDVRPSPREGMESAAARILNKLRDMASKLH